MSYSSNPGKGFEHVCLSEAELQKRDQAASEERASWLLLGGRRPRSAYWSNRVTKAGRFAPQQLYLTTGLRPSALGLALYVLNTSEADLQAGLLPQMKRALDLGDHRRTSVWNMQAPEPSLATPLRTHVLALLGVVASVLKLPQPGERRAWGGLLLQSPDPQESGSQDPTGSSDDQHRFNRNVFSRPPEVPLRLQRGSDAPIDSCLRLDRVALQQDKQAYLLQYDAAGYLRIQLTKHGRGTGTLFEWAHRLVTWCAYGPPPAELGSNPVAMHLCNNPDCLHPLHLRWGNHVLNDPRCEEEV
jgi:hypothetical protein